MCCLLVATGMVVVSGRVFGSEIDDRISELTGKIRELQNQEDSLSKQIKLLDSTIAIATLRIAGTKEAIDRLSREIDELAVEIERLEGLLTRRSQLVLRRIPVAYKRKNIPQFGMLFFARNFSEFLRNIKYLAAIQKEDAQLLFQLKATQQNFSERKDLREQKKVEQERLKVQLERQQRDLGEQKRNKQVLLEQTKNNESTYQKLLAQALAEKQAIEKALVDAVKVGPVKKGDPIALVGNSGYPGCSTGAHLHFEVRRGGSWVNPGEFLTGRELIDQQNGGRSRIGSGSWDWPLADPIVLTQHYGRTPYSWRYSYSGGIHTGLDMASNSSQVIRAPADGDLYSSSQNCGGSSIIKIKYIDHGGGIISFYLHVQ